MKTAIKKPISIVVFDYIDRLRMEIYHYDCKNEKPKNLLRTYTFQTEKEMIERTNELKEKYEVKDFFRNLLEDEEIDYIPHQQWKVFEWQPAELEIIIQDYFRRTYRMQPKVSIEYDQYKGSFKVLFEVSEGMEDESDFDEFCDRLFDDFTYEDEKESIYSMPFREIFPRILKEIVGSQLVMVYPKKKEIFGYSEMTWSGMDGAAHFFFE